MDKYTFNEICKQLEDSPDEGKIKLLDSYIKRTDIDKFSQALLCELIGKFFVKNKDSGGEYFEKAGSLLEDYWAQSHIHSNFGKSAQRDILYRSLKNYRAAMKFYVYKGLKVSENRVSKRIKDINSQLKGYNGVYRKLVIFLIFVSFLSSMTLFSHSFTGFSIANSDSEQSFLIGGIILFLGIIGVIYIIFFGFYYINGTDKFRIL